MQNCSICGANLGIYSRGIAMDKAETYVLCPKCYRGVSAFHQPLRKITSLEGLDQLEEAFEKRVQAGKIKEEAQKVIRVCFNEKRKELKIEAKILEQYDEDYHQESKSVSKGSVKKEKLPMTTGSSLPDEKMDVMGIVSSQRLISVNEVKEEEKVLEVKKELAQKIYEQAVSKKADAVVGLTFSIAALDGETVIVMADATVLKEA